MHKMLAAQAIVWIIATIFFMYQAHKDGVPLGFGIAASTITVGLGTIVALLLIVVIS